MIPDVRRWPLPCHTPTRLQLEAVECGAVALGIVLAYHGRVVPATELRSMCGVSRDGSKASSVLRAARHYGMEAKGYSKPLAALANLQTPYIVFWEFNHFVVVEGVRGGTVYLNDPAVGHRKVDMATFDRGFTGVVLVLRPGPEFVRGGREPSLLRGLLRRLSGAGGALALCTLAGLLLTAPGLAIPALTQVFLDHVVGEGRVGWLRPVVLALLALALVQAVLKVLQLRFLRRLQLSLAMRMSARFFWHLLQLPAEFYAQRYSGETSSRFALNDKVAGVLSGPLAMTLIDVAMMGFYAALMAFYDPWLTALAVGFAAVNLVALSALGRQRIEANMAGLQAYGKAHAAAIAGLQGIETVKASGSEDAFFGRWAGHHATALGVRQRIESSSQLLGALPPALGALAAATLLVVGGFRVIAGDLTIGMLVALQSLTLGFLQPVDRLVGLGTVLQELRGDLARLDDVLAHPAAAEEGPPGVAAASEDAEPARVRLRGALELQGVTFGYAPLEPPLLEEIDLSLAPGQRVALVGASGSGKSTVARLVCGLHQPWSGQVLLDGHLREDVPVAVLHNSLALVDQDPLLFADTVRNNLTLWDDTVPDRVIEDACEDAAIAELVRGLPGGLGARLEEGGANLSGGQRQRLEIARALVNQPSILVLDEATSALDAETERQIAERLALRGCSCLVVAHRLSTIRDCDEILVFDRGRIVERGTHEALWAAQGHYAELLRSGEGALTGAEAGA